MSQINITDFPEEILEKIFLDLYNSGGSLKSLTEVCKRFNHVICTRTKFMSKFYGNWNNGWYIFDVLLSSNRKYQEIKISDSYDIFSDDLLQFLKIQKSIGSFVLFHCKAYVPELMKILKAVKNIREIRIDSIELFNDQKLQSLNLPMLKKITLCNNEDKILTTLLNIFQDANNVEVSKRINLF